jgi:hypothetical protein
LRNIGATKSAPIYSTLQLLGIAMHEIAHGCARSTDHPQRSIRHPHPDPAVAQHR